MNLQDTFYILGIIFMTLSIVILIAIAVLIFYLKKRVEEIHRFVDEKIEDITTITSPVKKAVGFATSLLSGRSKSGKRKN